MRDMSKEESKDLLSKIRLSPSPKAMAYLNQGSNKQSIGKITKMTYSNVLNELGISEL